MKRRDFLKTSALGAAGVALSGGLQGCSTPRKGPVPYSAGGSARMKLSFFPYELQFYTYMPESVIAKITYRMLYARCNNVIIWFILL